MEGYVECVCLYEYTASRRAARGWAVEGTDTGGVSPSGARSRSCAARRHACPKAPHPAPSRPLWLSSLLEHPRPRRAGRPVHRARRVRRVVGRRPCRSLGRHHRRRRRLCGRARPLWAALASQGLRAPRDVAGRHGAAAPGRSADLRRDRPQRRVPRGFDRRRLRGSHSALGLRDGRHLDPRRQVRDAARARRGRRETRRGSCRHPQPRQRPHRHPPLHARRDRPCRGRRRSGFGRARQRGDRAPRLAPGDRRPAWRAAIA